MNPETAHRVFEIIGLCVLILGCNIAILMVNIKLYTEILKIRELTKK